MPTYRSLTNAVRIDVIDPQADPVSISPQGGGQVYTVPLSAFRQHYEPAPPAPFRAGTVTAECLPGVVLACYGNGDRWNGYGMPYFARAEVERLMAFGYALHWMGDTVVCYQDDEPEDYEPVVMPDGVPAWGVGAGSWLWDAVRFPADR